MYTGPTKEDLVVLFTTKEKRKPRKCPGDCVSVSACDIRETVVLNCRVWIGDFRIPNITACPGTHIHTHTKLWTFL